MIAWGTVPDWIVATSTTGAFVAAGFAARWAKRAASATRDAATHAKRQADAAQQQVKIAREQADAALADAARQRKHDERTHRLMLEDRLDARAPNVIGRAVPGYPDIGVSSLVRHTRVQYANEIPRDDLNHRAWVPITDSVLIPGPPVGMPFDVFAIGLTIDFTNHGDVAARIALEGNEVFELIEWQQGREFALAPSETKRIHFERRVAAPLAADLLNNGECRPDIEMFDLTYWVRDLGANVRDTFQFNADLRIFRLEGSEMRAFGQPVRPWGEDVASPTASRIYERLAAEQQDVT